MRVKKNGLHGVTKMKKLVGLIDVEPKCISLYPQFEEMVLNGKYTQRVYVLSELKKLCIVADVVRQKQKKLQSEDSIKFVIEHMKSVEMVNAMVKLIIIDFEVTDQKARELVDKISEYNIDCVADVFTLIETELGYKPSFKQ